MIDDKVIKGIKSSTVQVNFKSAVDMNRWTSEDLLRQLPVDQKAVADRLIKDISTRFTLVWSDKRIAQNMILRTEF